MTERDDLIAQAHAAVGTLKRTWRGRIRATPGGYLIAAAILLGVLSLGLAQVNVFVQSREISPELTRLRAENACRVEINAAASVALGGAIVAIATYVSTEGALIDAIAQVPQDRDQTSSLIAQLGSDANRLTAAVTNFDGTLVRQQNILGICGHG